RSGAARCFAERLRRICSRSTARRRSSAWRPWRWPAGCFRERTSDMKKVNALVNLAVAGFAFCVALSAAAPSYAASRSAPDLLSLVPSDAATVAVVRLNDLRESPLAAKLFANADRMATDGDAARFLEEAQLNPKKDVDVVVVAASPSAGRTNSPALVLFQGRFDTDRLAGAGVSRGAFPQPASARAHYPPPRENAGARDP